MIVKGLTQAEVDAREAEAQSAADSEKTKRELAEIEAQALRPLLAITAGIDTKEDRDKVKELAEKAKELRTKARKA